VYVTAALRDAVRHFTVDNDRVFLCGVGDGANMAMDVGSSHPDLFAGVIPVAPNPKWLGHFIEAWRNAQKLPFYIVAGELGGDSVKNLREIFLKWMPQGFPAVMSIYKGRGIEWYSAETPVIFDWMSRKTRVNGTATLALGTYRQPWIILRESDNRFYWLQTDQVRPGKSGGAPVPATVMGDIRGNNLIDIKSERVKHLTVWLSTDMIDWTKPVRVQLNGSVARDWPKPKPVEPNLEVMLEDYAERGDRRMLFLNKIELGNIP
jgi:pimeloyl-ACP methyl ester carboxylesterase